MSLVLSTLVAGFGLKLVSPWPGRRAATRRLSPMLGAGIVAVQVVSSALGGYLAGRFRTKWLNLHSHEAHFRDTAHGLLAWAVSTVARRVSCRHRLRRARRTGRGSKTPRSPWIPAIEALTQDAANIAAQISFFLGFGLLLSAFTAAVAAALGGLSREEMYAKYWAEEHVAPQPLAR